MHACEATMTYDVECKQHAAPTARQPVRRARRCTLCSSNLLLRALMLKYCRHALTLLRKKRRRLLAAAKPSTDCL